MIDIVPPAVEAFRLSPQQRSVWIAHQNGAQNSTQVTIQIDGELRSGLLKTALTRVIERHEILRTFFPRMQGMRIPVQVVSDCLPCWNNADLSEIDALLESESLESLMLRERQATFDLDVVPAVRALLVKMSGARHLLILTLPALCADTRSLRIIVRDMDRFYTGSPVNDEPVQYVQFAEWQNELLETEDEHRESGCAYWAKVARDLPSPPLLSFEDPPRDNIPYRANAVTVKLDRSVVSSMRDWARSNEVQQCAILMACWDIIVSRLTGQSDFTIWTLLDGRKYQDMQSAVGLIAAKVPIRSCFESSKHFCQIVQRINGARRDAVAAQEYYWGVAYSTDGSTLAADGFGFVYEDAPSMEDFNSEDLTLVDISCCVEPFKLQLSCIDSTDGLSLEFAYDARRYHESDIRRLCDYYCVLLDNALEHPDVPIASLGMLPQPERDLILHEWNNTERVFPSAGAVHHLFERQARAHPDTIALICEDEELTYAQLNSRANRLSHLLQSRGVVPDMPVGLCLERSTDLIVGLLGILKSGGAYLPLDPALPRERLCAMLQDSNACLVVSQASLAAGLPGEVVLVDRDAHILEQQNAENPMSEVSGEHLAYVIYTSGSTGRPKGVCIEHRNLLNYIYGVGERLLLDVGASYATVSTLSADLGHTTLFSSLCMGGCLHLISSERAMDPLLWREYFTTHQIDCLKIVGSHLAALIGSGEVYSELLPRKVLVLGGEACRWELVDRIMAGAPELRVLNHYGPTETTVGVLTYEVRAGMNRSVVGSATTPLGGPLANSRVYLLNDYQEPVGVGVVGEIYIGGSGVCRGYLNRPELTSERFLRDPFHEDSEARMYRSGDQGRYLSDGSVEFLGRMDHQVKIRGYRIELGEIENVLLRHGSVREAVIVAREDASGEKRLVGYVVGRDGPISGSELRDHLRVQLPEYMVPGWIVNLPRLPLTSNGKVDRSSLPSPEESEPDADIMGARTAVEEVLSGIWGELLHRDAIGVNQNFFELGGHSLLATQVISRIRETFEVEVPLRTIFEAPTIAAFAEQVTAFRRAGEGTTLPPLTRVPRNGRTPLSFSQQRIWFIDQLEPQSSHYNVPSALRIRGALNLNSLQRSLQAILARHEILRTRYAAENGSPIQIVSEETMFPLPLHDLSALDEPERETESQNLCRQEANRPFDLSSQSMMRARVMRMDTQDHILLLTLHHIACDGWSRSILVHELSILYNVFAAGGLSPLPELPIQYADYAVWQRNWLEGGAMQRQIDYWRGRLSGIPPVLDLPTDRPRDAALSHEGAALPFTIASELSTALRGVCRDARVTPFMALLAAFYVLLYRWTGQQDLVVGTDVANRTQPQIEGSIGFFLNHLVLRTNLSGDPSFRDVLNRVREVCLGAYANPELPFDKLVEILQPERLTSHTPIFQVLFVVQNGPRSAPNWSGLKLETVPNVLSTSKFDLSLFISETDKGYGGGLVYRTDLFDADSIHYLSEKYLGVLQQVLVNPAMAIGDVELVSETEECRAREAVERAGRMRTTVRRLTSISGTVE